MVIFIWTRKGYLVPVIAFSFLIIFQLLFNGVFGKGYYSSNFWVSALALALAGIICGLLGLHLNKNQKRVYIDKLTNKEVLMDRSHKFFFIKFEYWGIILIIIALIFLFAGIF
jgi:hypothetical protein